MRRHSLLLVSLLLGLSSAKACSPLLDVAFRPLAGKEPVHLCEAYDGKVLLIVNTASKCGFTPQFESLEALHAKYQARGFAVIGFPSNEFLGQDPGTEEEIKSFCTLTYGVQFPMFEKTKVRGDDANPLYKRLEEATGESPSWNFNKYVVNRQGKVVRHFGSRTRPDDKELIELIESLLDEAPPDELRQPDQSALTP